MRASLSDQHESYVARCAHDKKSISLTYPFPMYVYMYFFIRCFRSLYYPLNSAKKNLKLESLKLYIQKTVMVSRKWYPNITSRRGFNLVIQTYKHVMILAGIQIFRLILNTYLLINSCVCFFFLKGGYLYFKSTFKPCPQEDSLCDNF